MKKRLVLFLSAFQFFSFSAFPQGSLAPPGPPGPTMKTLDQTEPRVPISSLPFTISSPGSYYCTGNLHFTATTGDAITVSVGNVTIDLMGFTLSSSAAVTGEAVHINPNLRNIAVKDGTIVGNTTVTSTGTSPNLTFTTVEGGFSQGIDANSSPEAVNCQFSHLRISGCRTYGLRAGVYGIVEQVTAKNNGHTGIVASSGSVTNSAAALNGNTGISATTVSNSTATSNGIFGISVLSGSVTNCTALFNGGTGISAALSSVTSSSASSNGGDGIADSSGSVTNCTSSLNGSNGIIASSGVVAFCTASNNDTKNDGSANIVAGPTRTGNNPTP
jgi:hypothetical protein